MGSTWTWDSWTMVFGSVVRAVWTRNQLAGMPHPQEQWGAGSWKYWPRNNWGCSTGVGTPRCSLSSPTSYSLRRWTSAGPRILGTELQGGWNLGKSLYKGLMGGAEAERDVRKRRVPVKERKRTKPSDGSSIAQCCQGSLRGISVRELTERGEGVSSWSIFAQRMGNQLRRDFGRSTKTSKSPRVKYHVRSLQRVLGRAQNVTP